MLRKASPERVRSKVREEVEAEKEEEVGRNLSGGDAAWLWLLLLLPPAASFANVTLPMYSYAEQELIEKHNSTGSTKEESSLERDAEGHGRIF